MQALMIIFYFLLGLASAARHESGLELEAIADRIDMMDDAEVLEYEEDYGQDGLFGPPLCDQWIVKSACKIMDITRVNPKAVSLTELSIVTAVNRPSVIAFLKEIGFETAGDEGGQEEFPCMDLCQAVVKDIPEERLPPTSDVACRSGTDGEAEVVCDVDVSAGALSQVDFDSEDKDFHEGHPVDDGSEVKPKEPFVFDGSDLELDDATPQELMLRIANRFRIYPKIDIKVGENVGDIDISEDGGSDEQDSSLVETNTTGCNRIYCHTVNDCTRFASLCGGCRGCRGGSRTPTAPTRAPSPSPTRAPATTTRRPYWYVTPRPSISRRRTPVPSPSPPPPASSRPSWYADVERVSIKAQAYVAHALQAAPQSQSLMKQWFGRSDATTLAKVMKVLNSLSGMLGNVAYEKGPKCGPHTYAYVYPYGPNSKNSKGEFVFFLCSVYFRSDEGEKIETLTHEGSHHAVAYTDDVWADLAKTTKAYGRYTCRKLAKAFPDRAILNADSHCYFINDLNAHP